MTYLAPRGRHRDEVSYLEAFLVYFLLVGRRLNIGYIIMNHMVECCESKTRILPYGPIMTKVFKAFGINLTLEDEVEEPLPYDIYNGMSMGQMKFKKAADGSWVHPMEFGARDGHQGVDDDSDP